MPYCSNCSTKLNYLEDDKLWQCPHPDCGEIFADDELLGDDYDEMSDM